MRAPGLARGLVALAASAVLVSTELDRRPDLAARLAAPRAMVEVVPHPPREALVSTGTIELARRLAAGELASARSLARHLAALAPEAAGATLQDLLAALDDAERGRAVALVLGDVATSLDRGPQERLSLDKPRITYAALARADLDFHYRAAPDALLDLVLDEAAREARPAISARLVAWVGGLAQERAARVLAAIARDEARAHDVRRTALEGLARLDAGRPIKITALALEPLATDDESSLREAALDACVRLHHREAAAAVRRLAARLEHQAALTLLARVDYYRNERRREATRLLAEERPAEALFAALPLAALAPDTPPALEARCRALAGDPAGAALMLLPFDDDASTAGLIAALSAMPWAKVRALVDGADERAQVLWRVRWPAVRRLLPHLEARRDP